MKYFKNIATAVTALTLSACANLTQNVASDIDKAKKGPEFGPTKNITNFSHALRCMDNLMISYGVEKFSVLAENLDDKTEKINAGTRDMLITAVSDMTKRSRAINLIVYGNDSGHLISYLKTAGRKQVYNDVPKYDIRGSISQLDKDVVRKQFDAGAGIPEFGVGYASSAAGSILGVDLSIVDSSTLAVMPGVTSRNSIVIMKSGTGVDSDGTIRKAGINFSISFRKSEGSAQAVRNLIELATVELFGKLLKLPYWTCLGADPANPAIAQEIDDWFYSMKANNEIVGFTQNQLFKRGYYKGVIDGQPSSEYEKSVAMLKIDMKLPHDAKVDNKLFSAMLNTPMPEDAASRIATYVDPKDMAKKQEIAKAKLAQQQAQLLAQQKAQLESQQKAKQQAQLAAQQQSQQQKQQQLAMQQTPAAAPAKLNNSSVQNAMKSSNKLVISSRNKKSLFKPGERLTLVVKSKRSAHMYCFFHDDSKQIMRVFPNRFRKTSFVNADEEIELPGNMPFEVTASKNGQPETLGCFTTEREILDELPNNIRVLDFVSLDVNSMDDIRNSVGKLAGNSMSEAYFQIKTR